MIVKHANTQYHLPEGLSQRVQQRRLQETPEPELVARIAQHLAKHPGSVIHAGAFSGDLLPQLCAVADCVYAWEPVSYNYAAALETLELNSITNCEIRNAALSNSTDTLDIVTQFDGGYLLGGLCCVLKGNSVASPVLTHAHRPITETVRSEMIDSRTYTNLQVLHLDLEGWELAALEGAAHTVAAHRPVIILEDTERTCDTLLAEWNYVYTETVSGDRVYEPNKREAPALAQGCEAANAS